MLGGEPHSATPKTGPNSQLQRKFEQVKLLPREKQKFIIQFIDTVLDSKQKQRGCLKRQSLFVTKESKVLITSTLDIQTVSLRN